MMRWRRLMVNLMIFYQFFKNSSWRKWLLQIFLKLLLIPNFEFEEMVKRWWWCKINALTLISSRLLQYLSHALKIEDDELKNFFLSYPPNFLSPYLSLSIFLSNSNLLEGKNMWRMTRIGINNAYIDSIPKTILPLVPISIY